MWRHEYVKYVKYVKMSREKRLFVHLTPTVHKDTYISL